MKRQITILTIALALSLASGLHASDALKAIVGSYLQIHAQLASDKLTDVKTPAAAIAKQAASLGDPGAPIAKAAKAMSGAADLKAAREAMGPLSDAIIAAAKAEGYKDLSDIRVVYCPMVQKSWIQKDKDIKNPYFGPDMLACGEFKK